MMMMLFKQPARWEKIRGHRRNDGNRGCSRTNGGSCRCLRRFSFSSVRACGFVTTGEIEIFIKSPAAHSSTSSHFFQSGPKTKPSGHIQNTLKHARKRQVQKQREIYVQNIYNIPLKGTIVIEQWYEQFWWFWLDSSMKMQNEFCTPPLSREWCLVWVISLSWITKALITLFPFINVIDTYVTKEQQNSK